MEVGKDHTTLSEINVTPFVDVMLVLLVIFMVTAPMLRHGIDVDLPKASVKPVEIGDRQLILTITKAEKIFVHKNEINLKDLRPKLQKLYEGRTDKEIFLRADKEVSYGFVVKVMAEIKNAGIEKLGMITEPLEQ